MNPFNDYEVFLWDSNHSFRHLGTVNAAGAMDAAERAGAMFTVEGRVLVVLPGEKAWQFSVSRRSDYTATAYAA